VIALALTAAAVAGPVGVVFLGDAGTGSPEQHAVSAAIEGFCAAETCDLALTLGDNVYPDGVASPDDPLWQSRFEAPYANLDLVFKPALGNHDHRQSPEAQVAYSERSERWDMPARFYRFEARDVVFYALDTTTWDKPQHRWLRRALKREAAEWVVVYGHHPIRSGGSHGDTEVLVSELEPLLHGRAQLYLAGHDHALQAIQGPSGLTYVVSGGGGAPVRPVQETDATLFASSVHGFGHLLIDGDAARLRLVDVDGEVVFDTTIERELP